ncbi:unnamed protein product [Caenorhabditis brenneri]
MVFSFIFLLCICFFLPYMDFQKRKMAKYREPAICDGLEMLCHKARQDLHRRKRLDSFQRNKINKDFLYYCHFVLDNCPVLENEVHEPEYGMTGHSLNPRLGGNDFIQAVMFQKCGEDSMEYETAKGPRSVELVIDWDSI